MGWVQAAAHRCHELIGIDGFPQDALIVQILKRLSRAGHHYDGNALRLSVGSDFLLNRTTVKEWKTQVENDKIWDSLIEVTKRIHTIAHIYHIETGARERGPIESTECFVIFDNEDREAVGHYV